MTRLELHHKNKVSCAVLPPSRMEAMLPPMLEITDIEEGTPHRHNEIGADCVNGDAKTVRESNGPMIFRCSRCKQILWGGH